MIALSDSLPSFGVRRGAVLVCQFLSIATGAGVLLTGLLWLVSVDVCLSVTTKQVLVSPVPPITLSTHNSSESSPVSTEEPGDIRRSGFVWESRTAGWLPERVQPRLFSLLSRDLSTVTPGLLMVLLVRVHQGCRLVARRRIERMLADEFPFAPGFRLTWVQLGLIGTLWGFLLLGFGLENQGVAMDPGLSGQETINLLIQAFGTALLSTFAAVVLAYLVAPTVQRLFALCLRHPFHSGTREIESIEFTLWVEKSVQALKDLAAAVGANQGPLVKSFESLSDRVESAADRFEKTFTNLVYQAISD